MFNFVSCILVKDTPGDARLVMCYTEKATEARHRLGRVERQYNCKKHCRPDLTKPYSNAIHPGQAGDVSFTFPDYARHL